ncbi:protein phosphatase regulator PIG1 [Saccharomyces eubayanus]|uniref:protein phosphatase regulator PIG1 n=1 Tax=Saccharomyces eubayanus TaxID=1080349 RepID=UPI0006BECE6A|nr:PIG1-like protein [Saccharomyces eubayanus]KOG97961.1 PIG1-like protein [Saccharomyces eubayanus]
MPVSSLNYCHGRKLKPSLKIAKTTSISSFISSAPSNSFSPVEDTASASSSASSSSSGKSVRFATHLYTVKKFNTKLAPISISERASNLPAKYITSQLSKSTHSSYVPLIFPVINSEDHPYSLDILDYSDLEYDDKDDEYDNESDVEEGAKLVLDRNLLNKKEDPCLGEENKFDIVDWKLINSNLHPFKSNGAVNLAELESRIFSYLNGQNIKVHSLELSSPVSHEDFCHNNFGSCQFSGLVFVNNLNFEKNIEIKFTLSNWSDIHYINARFNKSITSKIDEFRFVIDFSALKLNLVSKNLIFANSNEKRTDCILNLQFCCRYDVNYLSSKTFYDNNDYRNYEVTISLSTIINLNRGVSKFPKHESKHASLLLTDCSAGVHILKNNDNVKKPLRKFNDDTDYFNDSPLKHKFHHSFGREAAYQQEGTPPTTRLETNDSEIKPFGNLVEASTSDADEDIVDGSYDLSLQDFNYWEFTNHGLGKALADSDILQFKNYSKPEAFSRYPLIDNSFTLRAGDGTLRLTAQELEDSSSDGRKSTVTSTTLNAMQQYSDEFRASLSYTNHRNDSTDTLMKTNNRPPIESTSPSQLSVSTIKVKESTPPQENTMAVRIRSSPAFSPVDNMPPPPFFSGDNMSDSSGEYEDTISLNSKEIHLLRDCFSKSASPSPSPSPIFL